MFIGLDDTNLVNVSKDPFAEKFRKFPNYLVGEPYILEINEILSKPNIGYEIKIQKEKFLKYQPEDRNVDDDPEYLISLVLGLLEYKYNMPIIIPIDFAKNLISTWELPVPKGFSLALGANFVNTSDPFLITTNPDNIDDVDSHYAIACMGDIDINGKFIRCVLYYIMKSKTFYIIRELCPKPT